MYMYIYIIFTEIDTLDKITNESNQLHHQRNEYIK